MASIVARVVIVAVLVLIFGAMAKAVFLVGILAVCAFAGLAYLFSENSTGEAPPPSTGSTLTNDASPKIAESNATNSDAGVAFEPCPSCKSEIPMDAEQCPRCSAISASLNNRPSEAGVVTEHFLSARCTACGTDIRYLANLSGASIRCPKCKTRTRLAPPFTVPSHNRKYKTDSKTFRDLLKKFGIKYFYHVTDAQNLPLIARSEGLCALSLLEKYDIRPPRPGGNEMSHQIDWYLGHSSFVHLSVVKNHPMIHVALKEGRIGPELVLFEISPEVVLWEKTRFSPDIANKKGVEIGDDVEAFNKIPFDFGDLGTSKSEILVSAYIHKRFIRNWDSITQAFPSAFNVID